MHLSGFLDQLAAPLGSHAVAYAPVYNVPGMQVDDGTQVHEAPSHWHIGDIDAPDLIPMIYFYVFQ